MVLDEDLDKRVKEKALKITREKFYSHIDEYINKYSEEFKKVNDLLSIGDIMNAFSTGYDISVEIFKQFELLEYDTIEELQDKNLVDLLKEFFDLMQKVMSVHIINAVEAFNEHKEAENLSILIVAVIMASTLYKSLTKLNILTVKQYENDVLDLVRKPLILYWNKDVYCKYYLDKKDISYEDSVTFVEESKFYIEVMYNLAQWCFDYNLKKELKYDYMTIANHMLEIDNIKLDELKELKANIERELKAIDQDIELSSR